MKTVLTGLAVSFSLVAGIAQASPVNSPEPKTRAEVVAELREARALGLISDGELDYPTLKSEPLNSKSRQEVLSALETAHEARSEDHKSELQSLMPTSYEDLC